ncbi:hypothetical protein BV25DRAFT_1002354 [Artomyces pyxidatus]|uniref:Uncharacterized protein n=1 Tax=Artomyces pyxidatus TaxID=48021 RepID=A0ACB8STQ2_9AGAM|nr:hypothetical protein BV25DRAFT_1002354 [Artomyces pyxidatus]
MIPPREKTKRRTKDVLTANINESDENFDLNAISADDEPDNAPNLPAIPPGRPVAVARRPGLSYEEATKSAPAHDNEGDESFDLDAISEDSDGEPLAQDSRHNTARSYGQQKHSYRRRKSTAHRERPNFDIFQLSGDASPIADPSSSRRHHGLGGQHSPKSIPPPSSRPNAQKYKRLSILEGEVDFFANDGSPSSPDEHSLGLTSRRAMPDLADALSTLSVSSPASSPPRPAAVPRRRDFGDFSDDESQKVIVISD